MTGAALLFAGGLALQHKSVAEQPISPSGKPPFAEPQGLIRPAAVNERTSGADRFGDLLPPAAVARLGTGRLHHTGLVQGVAFSPDGKILASTAYDNSIRLWDRSTGKPVKQLTLAKVNQPSLPRSRRMQQGLRLWAKKAPSESGMSRRQDTL